MKGEPRPAGALIERQEDMLRKTYLDGVEHRREVGVDDGLPLLGLHAGHERVLGDARVVDKDVQRAVLANHIAHELGHRCRIADVGLECSGLAARGHNGLADLVCC